MIKILFCFFIIYHLVTILPSLSSEKYSEYTIKKACINGVEYYDVYTHANYTHSITPAFNQIGKLNNCKGGISL